MWDEFVSRKMCTKEFSKDFPKWIFGTKPTLFLFQKTSLFGSVFGRVPFSKTFLFLKFIWFLQNLLENNPFQKNIFFLSHLFTKTFWRKGLQNMRPCFWTKNLFQKNIFFEGKASQSIFYGFSQIFSGVYDIVFARHLGHFLKPKKHHCDAHVNWINAFGSQFKFFTFFSLFGRPHWPTLCASDSYSGCSWVSHRLSTFGSLLSSSWYNRCRIY